MGCGDSRPQPEDEIPPGLRPFWRRLQELKRYRMEDLRRRRRRDRKESVVSTAELFHPDETDAIEEEPNRKAEEDSGDVRRFRREPTAAEELPGSPSFRFYLSEPGRGSHANPVRGNHQDKLSDVMEMMHESN